MNATKTTYNYICLYALSAIAIWLWSETSTFQARWSNVPPTPNNISKTASALGDSQLAYRSYGLMLQNLGNSGGRFTPLKDYNYDRLGEWFMLQHALDPKANFTPMLAAYYFGASQDSSKLRPLIDYLAIVGDSPEGEKWRWLARAVYLAQFKLKDLDLALNLAYKLKAIQNPDMPMWARQMPANILNQRGEKESALALIMGILETSAGKIHPNEVNALVAYICEQVLNEQEAKDFPLCQ